MKLFTIALFCHSPRIRIEAFISLLQQHGITAVVDVRSHPYSRYLPDISQSALKAVLLNIRPSSQFSPHERPT